MIKNYILIITGILLIPMVGFAQLEGPRGRAAWEYSITKDPRTGLVPLGALENGRKQVMQSFMEAKKFNVAATTSDLNWKERGPSDIGGRTRAIMWDPQNGTFTPKRKKVWAGGVSGGLWTNNDISDANSSWIKVAPGQLWDNIAISSLAYDPTNKQILYAATGERDASGNDNFRSGIGGGGIWKSVDGGTNWNLMESTIPDYTLTFDKVKNEADAIKIGWREIYKLIVTPTGVVLALTKGGILKSDDKALTWNRLKGPNAPGTFASNGNYIVSDMQLGIGGTLYVAEGNDEVPPRILKSTDNTYTNFQICPFPPNTTYRNGIVKIALTAQDENQIIYAVSAAPSNTYGFFLKSVNGGTDWVDMTPSTYQEEATDADGNAITQIPFFGGQYFWGLILGTHKDKPDVLYAGGVSFDMSFDGGNSWLDEVKKSPWNIMSDVMHADHHSFEANPENNDEAIFGNDGGVYYSDKWSVASTTLAGLNIQRRNKNYNIVQYYSVDFHPLANNGLVVGGSQDNGTHAISSAYDTVGSGLIINGGDGALTFIDQVDPKIVISSYTNVSPKLHKKGAIEEGVDMSPSFDNRGTFINSADYDSPAHTYYANLTNGKQVTKPALDTLVIRYKITPSVAAEDSGYTYIPSYLTYPVSPQNQGIEVSFMKLGKTTNATSNRVLYVGTPYGDVFKTSPFSINGDQTVSLTKIMNFNTTGPGNVSSIDFGSDENTMIVTKSNYNVKSVFYTTNANAGTNTTWISKDETSYGLPNIPIRYALINPTNTKQVLLATNLGVWSTSDITKDNPDWKETNEALARVRCDMLKYRPSDGTVIVGTHGRGIFSTQLNAVSPPIAATPQVLCSGSMVANLTATGTAIQWYATPTGGSALATTTVLATGTYYASQTIGGVESSRTEARVTINPTSTPTVSISPTVVCSGVTQAIITTATNAGTTPTYLWKKNGLDLATTKDITVPTAVAADVYSLTLTPSANACANPATVTTSLTIGGVGCTSVIISITSGNWETPATWNLNRIPTFIDKVIVDSNHTVTLTTSEAKAKNVETRPNGKVIFNSNTTQLKLGF